MPHSSGSQHHQILLMLYIPQRKKRKPTRRNSREMTNSQWQGQSNDPEEQEDGPPPCRIVRGWQYHECKGGTRDGASRFVYIGKDDNREPEFLDYSPAEDDPTEVLDDFSGDFMDEPFEE